MGPKRQAASSNRTRTTKRTKGSNGVYDDPPSDHDESAGPSRRRNQMMIEDEDDDIQGAYEEADGHYVEDIFIPPKYNRIEPPQTGERLVIEKIVCENFKSYGGMKEMGPFHKNFSAIVGPNGNGKSNIIDAMLFVFGYRAAKIRCKKVSVLIHKSELLPNLSSCAVTVHFVKIHDDGQSDDTFNMIPNSRITVTRRAYADNSSAYWLDGKKVTFQVVARFLKENGIDIVHNRFLILQGEVESIAQMPPKTPNGLETGLLEFLEEVIGTKRYLKPLCDLETRVEQLDYEREEKLHRVDLVEKEKQAMHEPVKKAKDFLRDQNTRCRYQHQICQVKNLQATRKAKELQDQIAPVQEQIKGVNDRLQEIAAINETRKSEFEKEEKTFNSIKTEHDKKKKALEANEAEYLKHFENIKRANEQRKKVQKDKAKNERDLEKLEEIPRTHDGEKAKLLKRKEELVELIAAEEEVVEREMGKLNEKIALVLKDKTEKDKEKNKWLPIRHEKNMKVEQIKRELDKYQATEAEAKENLEKYRQALQELEDSIAEREGKSDRTSLEAKLAGLQKDLSEKEAEYPAVAQEEQVKRNEMVNVSTSLQEAKESLEGSGATDQIYKLFFGEKDQGRLQGLYGRLKDLATIDEKYNVAVTVSTGMLDHWVVDTDDTGTQCINLLKQRGMPFQNFVCLNRLRDMEQQMKRRFDAPSQSQRLFDLLNITTPAVATAFYKALRDTLVCDNIHIGSEIAYGRVRHRVATLAGELIEPSGAMTGGGRARIIGKMNSGMAARLTSTVTRKDVEKLQRQYETLNRELIELGTHKTRLETEIFNLKTQIKATSDEIKNFHGDLQNLKSKRPLLQKRITDQEAKVREVTVDPKVVKENQKALKLAQEESEQVAESSKDAIEAADKVDEKLNDMKTRQKDEIRKKLDKLKQQHKGVMEEIDKIAVDLKNYEKNKARAENKIASLEKEVEKLENDMRTWTQLRKDIEEGSKVIKTELEKLAEGLDEAKETLMRRKEVLNEFKDEEKKLAKTKVELDAKIEEVTNNLKGLHRHIQHNQQVMNGLVLKDIPEEEVPPLTILPEEEVEALNYKELEAKLAKYEKKIQGESPNLNILDEYNKKIELFLARVSELDAVTARRDKFRDAFITTTAQRLAEFMEGFAIISSKLKEMFRMISMGGDAELDLVDSTDPFSSGVQFSVRPARKTWKKISNLSGGEKTLSSLALIFALHYFKPSPFYVMDEIDAALDFKNVSIIANYIKDRTKFTQFIIISLRSNMFELADSLLGVYKVDNMSYSIHIGVSKLLSAMKVKTTSEGGKNPEDGVPNSQQSEEAGSSKQMMSSDNNVPNSQSSVATQVIGSQPMEFGTQQSSSGTCPVSSTSSNAPSSQAPSSDLVSTEIIPGSQSGNSEIPATQAIPTSESGSSEIPSTQEIPASESGSSEIPATQEIPAVQFPSSVDPTSPIKNGIGTIMGPPDIPSPVQTQPTMSSGSQSSSSSVENPLGLGRPLFSSTPIRTAPIPRRSALPGGIIGLEGIQEENSGQMETEDAAVAVPNEEEEEEEEEVGDLSQIIAGPAKSTSTAAAKANFNPEDFEFNHSSSSDSESELSATFESESD